ncbi:MAG: mannonate dehydratase [Sulfobacillus thermosulfidooxidans]|nr:MAG: mannonate dehydratase [Sulfobacillus thermosulfidooxidans]
MIRFAEFISDPQPTTFWQLLKQVGVTEVVGVLPRQYTDWRQMPIDHPWDYTALALYKEMIEEEGLALTAIEDNPPMDRIRYGKAGSEEELDIVCTFIENLGRLGVSIWCYNWAAGLGWQRTATRLRGRGDAIVSGYDHRLVGNEAPPMMGPVDHETLWHTLERFLERVVPVAERAGVRLALHPDDPPMIPEIRGVARIMNSIPAFERLLALNPSSVNGITLCQGNFTLMTNDLPQVIRTFVSQDRVPFVHFRDVRGTAEHFVETFIDEGQTDLVECMRAYRDAGFDGIMRTDHTPTLAGDTATVPGYSVLGRLHAIGYMAGLRDAVNAEISQDIKDR